MRYHDAITSTGARLHVWWITHALLLVREFMIAIILSIVCWLETHYFTCRSIRNHTLTFSKVSPHSTPSPHSRSTAIFLTFTHYYSKALQQHSQQYSISLMFVYTTPDSTLYLCLNCVVCHRYNNCIEFPHIIMTIISKNTMLPYVVS